MSKLFKIVGYLVVAIVVPGGIIMIIAKKRKDIGILTQRLFFQKIVTINDSIPASHFPLAPWHRMQGPELRLNQREKPEEIPQWAMCS